MGRTSASRPVTQRSSLPRQVPSYLTSSAMCAFRKRDDGGGRQSTGGRPWLLRQRDSPSKSLWRGVVERVGGGRINDDGADDGVCSGADANERSFWAVHGWSDGMSGRWLGWSWRKPGGGRRIWVGMEREGMVPLGEAEPLEVGEGGAASEEPRTTGGRSDSEGPARDSGVPGGSWSRASLSRAEKRS